MVSLQEYLQRVYELEKAKLEQTEILRGIDQRINSIEYKLVELDNRGEINQKTLTTKKSKLEYGLLILCSFFSILLIVINCVGGEPKECLNMLVSEGTSDTELSNFMSDYLFIGPLIMAVCMLYQVHRSQKIIREQEAKIEEYNYNASYQNNKHARQRIVCTNKMQYLNESKNLVVNQIQKTTSLLESYYSLNILFPKYRDIYAVASIYEYILSGRCYELQGHEGAYNLYEHELQMGMIISRLDRIIDNLESIKRNQRMLYDAIQESNNLSRRIMYQITETEKTLNRIAVSNETIVAENAIISYNSKRALEELELQKWLNYYFS